MAYQHTPDTPTTTTTTQAHILSSVHHLQSILKLLEHRFLATYLVFIKGIYERFSFKCLQEAVDELLQSTYQRSKITAQLSRGQQHQIRAIEKKTELKHLHFCEYNMLTHKAG